jgi:hypothetical protein
MIMTKTDNASQYRELQDSELEIVSGGIWFLGYRAATNSSLVLGIKGESTDDRHKGEIEIN